MKHTYPGQRFRLMVILCLVTFMALSSYWVSLIIQKRSSDPRRKTTSDAPDYHINNFNFVKMSPEGEPRYHLHGTKMTHFPNEDALKIEHPIIKSMDESKPAQTMGSQRATLTDGNSKLHMYGRVQVNRAATPNSDALNLATEYLLVLLDEDIIQTKEPVTIYHGNSTMEGIGMYVNNVTREFRLLEQVKVKIAPPNQEEP